MNKSQTDRWTAFLASLAVPGAGQLLACHWSCLPWFLGGVGATILPGLLEPLGPALSLVTTCLALAAVGLLSAEHAKRCLEPGADRRSRTVSNVTCGRMDGAGVDLTIALDIPRPHADVWTIVGDLPRFVCTDPFHRRVVVLRTSLQQGAALALEHCAFGMRFWRFGRLLKWRAGEGYAFSDLSARGPRHGFPHVFFVSVMPAGPDRTRLTVRVRGKWTARFVPRWLVRCWLHYVCLDHARLLRRDFEERD